MARPDERTITLLGSLAAEPGNHVVIISGRDRQTLDNWFGSLSIGLVAEHGAWIKEAGQSWQLVKPLANEWKEKLLPILEIYTDRLPGAFVEDKELFRGVALPAGRSRTGGLSGLRACR